MIGAALAVVRKDLRLAFANEQGPVQAVLFGRSRSSRIPARMWSAAYLSNQGRLSTRGVARKRSPSFFRIHSARSSR